MKLIPNYFEFKKITQPVRDDFDLDIAPDFFMAYFFPSRLEDMKRYCIANPEFHIMSIIPDAILVNRPMENAKFLFFGLGDADHDLRYCDSLSKELHKYSILQKFDRD